VTEDSQSRRQGDGPPPEDAEPTEPSAAPFERPTEPIERSAEPIERSAGSVPEPVKPTDEPPERFTEPPRAPIAEPPEQSTEPPAPIAEPPERSTEPPAPTAEPPEWFTAQNADTPSAQSVTPPHPHIPAQRLPGSGLQQPTGGAPQPGDNQPYPVSGSPVSPPYGDAPYATDPYAFDQPIYRPGTPDPGPAYGPFYGAGAQAPDAGAQAPDSPGPGRGRGVEADAAAQAPDARSAPQAPRDPDPYGFAAPPGRRIEPSPPPDRRRLYFSALAGLLAGLVLFGTAGWFVGRATAPDQQAQTPAEAPKPGQAPGIFEQNQIAINGPDFAGTGLVAIAEGWLPYLATCTRNGSPGGPALGDGEKTRVRCTLDGMSAIFVEYASTEERDRARAVAIRQGADTEALAPGAAEPTERKAPSARTEGNYVEYAYRLTERGTTRTVSGLWWDDAQTPVAGYLLAYWKDGVGESWAPMRDLWSRYA
jgi:hypothetical protein